MAGIRESGTGSRLRYVVSFQDEATGQNTASRFRTPDAAALFFWQVETSAHQLIPVVTGMARVSRWPLKKVIWYWLGYQYHRVENHRLSLASYLQYRQHLTGMPEELMQVTACGLTPRHLAELTVTQKKYLRFAFGLLVENHWLTVNPIGKLPGRARRWIELPERETLVRMLDEADRREKLAVLLGAVCGLRPGELVSLRYSDVSREKIIIRRHLTPQGEREGTKRGPGREMDMPDEVWDLLDKSLLGTQRPVIAGRSGRRMSLNYSKQGNIRQLLRRHNIRRYYDLRHFAITNLLRRGATMADAAEFAGHSDPSVTAKVYTHFLRQRRPLTGSLNGE